MILLDFPFEVIIFANLSLKMAFKQQFPQISSLK